MGRFRSATKGQNHGFASIRCIRCSPQKAIGAWGISTRAACIPSEPRQSFRNDGGRGSRLELPVECIQRGREEETLERSGGSGAKYAPRTNKIDMHVGPARLPSRATAYLHINYQGQTRHDRSSNQHPNPAINPAISYLPVQQPIRFPSYG